MALTIADLRCDYKAGKKKIPIKISVVFNVDGSSINAAWENFLARKPDASDVTVWRFCEYVTSKDSSYICIPFEQWNLIAS